MIVIVVTAVAALLALTLSLGNTSAAANIAAFVLVVSSFGPTLALSALPANLNADLRLRTQTVLRCSTPNLQWKSGEPSNAHTTACRWTG